MKFISFGVSLFCVLFLMGCSEAVDFFRRTVPQGALTTKPETKPKTNPTPNLSTPFVAGVIRVEPSEVSFGIQSVSRPTDRKIELWTEEAVSVSTLRWEEIPAPFKLKGGQYPGTGGTCGEVITQERCSIYLTYEPSELGNHSGAMEGTYFDGEKDQFLSLSLSGTSIDIPSLEFSLDDATIDVDEVDFGTLARGASVTRKLYVKFYGLSDGSRPATEVNFRLGGPFSLVENHCGSNVKEDCSIVVRYTSQGDSAQVSAAVSYNNTSFIAEDRIGLRGASTPERIAPVLTLDAQTSFDTTLVGQHQVQTVQVRYSGTLPAVSVSSALSGVFDFHGGTYPGAGGTCGQEISADCVLRVAFSPNAPSAFSQSLVIHYDDGQGPKKAESLLSGEGKKPAQLTLEGAELVDSVVDFGDVSLNYTIHKRIHVVNPSGGSPANQIRLEGLSSAFARSKSRCTQLNGGESCHIELFFKPKELKAYENAVRISYSDGVETKSIPFMLKGKGIANALLTFSPGTMRFYGVPVGQTKTVNGKLRYYGSLPAKILSVSLPGPFTTAGCFASSGHPVFVTKACEGTASFTPTQLGPEKVRFRIMYDDGTGQNRVASAWLRGEGAEPSTLSLAPQSPLSFGNVSVGSSATQTLTVQRAGLATISDLELTGLGGAFQRTGGTCKSTLVSASCTYLVRFTPTTSGTQSKSLTLSYHDGSAVKQLSYELQGTGVISAKVTLSSVDFGKLSIGGKKQQTLKLTNTGTGAAHGFELTSSSKDFLLGEGCQGPLEPGASCEWPIEFAPTLPGKKSTTLELKYQDPQSSYSVQGEAVGSGTVAPLVATGGHTTCVRTDLGELKCFGSNQYGQLGFVGGDQSAPTQAVALGSDRYADQIAIGMNHVCAILDNGQVKCWGRNDEHQLGFDTSGKAWGGADNQMGEALPALNLGGKKASQLALGSGHSCALLEDKSVRCWGANMAGQLGLGDTVHRAIPTEIPVGAAVASLAASADNTAFVFVDGGLKIVGDNFFGQLGTGTSLVNGLHLARYGDEPGETVVNQAPVNVGSGVTVKSVALGGGYAVVLLNNQRVKVFGYHERDGIRHGNHGRKVCENSERQIGDCDAPGFQSALGVGTDPSHMGDALPFLPFTDVKALASSGEFHNCVVLQDKSLRCWGENGFGQVGQGDSQNWGETASQLTPFPAVDLNGKKVKEVHAGFHRSCAVLHDDSIVCWGDMRGGFGPEAWGDEPGEMGAGLPSIPF